MELEAGGKKTRMGVRKTSSERERLPETPRQRGDAGRGGGQGGRPRDPQTLPQVRGQAVWACGGRTGECL